jgi:Zn-dependent M28 family amino/carboxypeptidase
MNRNLAIKIVVFLMIAAMILPALSSFDSCNSSKTNNGSSTPATEPKPSVQVTVPTASADTAFNLTAKQVAFGPRVPNSAAHKACKQWLVKKLKQYGATVEEQVFSKKAYTGATLSGTNIIAKFNPSNSRRVMLAAHWDTRHIADKDKDKSKNVKSFDGADDGASGVGMLLEIARTLQQNPTEIGVDIVLFDVEDYGDMNGATETWCLGSQYWAENKGSYNARFGILLDMAGAKNARFGKEGHSMQFAPVVCNKIWKIAEELGHGNYFVNEQSSVITDDHYYVNQVGIPMIDIINLSAEGNFGHYHHTTEDNMSVIDKGTLNAVLQTVLTVLYREDKSVF